MRRVALAVSVVFVVLGAFWAGRESSHGVAAFWEHWWCPVPLMIIFLGVSVGVAAVVVTRRRSSVV
jgi:hypothetical protein